MMNANNKEQFLHLSSLIGKLADKVQFLIEQETDLPKDIFNMLTSGVYYSNQGSFMIECAIDCLENDESRIEWDIQPIEFASENVNNNL